MRAARDLGVRSPLQEVGLAKAEIRLLSQELGLRTWDKPAVACLSSRFAYGDPITVEKCARLQTPKAPSGASALAGFVSATTITSAARGLPRTVHQGGRVSPTNSSPLCAAPAIDMPCLT